MNSISKLVLLLFVSISISACGGNKKSTSKGNTANPAKEIAANTGDITRPPVVEKDVVTAESTSTDGGTISFDEWRKRRQAEKEKGDQ